MMRGLRAAVHGLVIAGGLGLAVNTPALEMPWFEPFVAGQLSGELRLNGVADGPVVLTTPGQPLEQGIVRRGDRVIVVLTEPDGTAKRPASPPPLRLVVVAAQGDQRIERTFVLPVPTPPVSPPIADRPTHPVPPDPTTPPADGPNPIRSAALAPPDPQPLCPVLAIRPGSLRRNVSRLLVECGSRLGRWFTAGAADGVRLDWTVHDPEVMTRTNAAGLDGLLQVLQARFRLQGVSNLHTDAIDIYVARSKVFP